MCGGWLGSRLCEPPAALGLAFVEKGVWKKVSGTFSAAEKVPDTLSAAAPLQPDLFGATIGSMSQRNLLLLLLAIAASYVCYVQGAQNPYGRYVANGLASIKDHSLDPVPNRELFDAAMEGMIQVLRQHGDEHSQFLGEEKAGQLRSEIHQQIGDIGAPVGLVGKPPQLMIVGPAESGTPAAKANLRPGDRILQIDDKPTADMSLNDAQALIRGEPGTSLRIVVQKKVSGTFSAADEVPDTLSTLRIELVRAVIQVESILGDRRGEDGRWIFTLADDPRIAHIRIVAFGERTPYEFTNVMRKLQEEGAQAIVLDLRGNAGGSLGAAVAVSEMLLPAGKTIAETRARDQVVRQRYATTSDGEYREILIAVIVNRTSASAAEIVAACLQDHGRAIVVGERSFGKGTVQQVLPLESGKSLLKLTWAAFWRPNGRNVHRAMGAPDDATWGVLPDAGFEHKLSPEKLAVYQEYRSRRDAFRLSAATEDPEIAEATDQAKSDDFVDEPLNLAERYLATKLIHQQ
jgi:carboxyl-terminal processing protease